MTDGGRSTVDGPGLAQVLLQQLVEPMDRPRSLPADNVAFDAVLATVERHRVVPLLVAAVHAGDVVLEDADRQRLLAAERRVAETQVLVESRLLEVLDALDDADLKWALLKGVAVAHLDYGDPSLRQFGDADLLVSAAQLGHAIEAVAFLGWSPVSALPGGHLEFTHAFPMRHSSGGDVDLHQVLGRRSIGVRIPTADLLARRVPFALAGRPAWALDPADRLLHATVHGGASRGPFRRWSSVADVIVLTRSDEVDPTIVFARAAAWRVTRLVTRVLINAHTTAGLSLPVPWGAAMASAPAGHDRLFERAYLSDTRHPVSEELVFLRDLSWAQRRRYVTGYLRTDSAYAGKHGRSGAVDQIRYLVRRLRNR